MKFKKMKKAKFLQILKTSLMVLFMFTGLIGCQTVDMEDLQLKLRGGTTPQKGEDPKEPPSSSEVSLDQTKINANKLFNTSSENIHRFKIGLILGPGLSYTLNHLGVLKAINDQKIPIEVIGGLGWSSLIAANYALNRAVNDMRWKAFQGNFVKAVHKGFISGSLKELPTNTYKTLINQYTRGRNLDQGQIKFICPVLNMNSFQVSFYRSGRSHLALQACMKVPPLAQSEVHQWGYVLQIQSLARQMRQMGAERVIFVNVLPLKPMNWGRLTKAVEPRDKYFWSQVQNSLNHKVPEIDHYLRLSSGRHEALDFERVRSMIESTEHTAQRFFIEFAKTYNL